MEELRKPIPGFEGRYEASNTGFIRNAVTLKILSGDYKSRGYYKINITKNGETKKKKFRVHRLVAFTWIPNEDVSLEINHINGNKLDNNINNLTRTTRSQNMQHAYDEGLMRPLTGDKWHKVHDRHKHKIGEYMKGRRGKDHPCSKTINQYALDGTLVNSFSSAQEAATSMGLYSSASIVACANHIPYHNTAKGFRWEYVTQ